MTSNSKFIEQKQKIQNTLQQNVLKNRLKLNLEMTESIKKRKGEKMMVLKSIGLLENFKQSLKSPKSSDMLNFLSERNEGSVVSGRDKNYGGCISINS